MRYVVFAVACLECTSGDSVPEIDLMTNDFDEALNVIAESNWSGQEDKFIFDTVTGEVTSAHARTST